MSLTDAENVTDMDVGWGRGEDGEREEDERRCVRACVCACA